jgi:hypothetical protein
MKPVNRLNIFNHGKPPPVIVVDTTTRICHYQGCFTCALSPISSFKPLLITRHGDITAARTLRAGVNIPGGTTAACAAAGGFVNAGLENRHECRMSRSHGIYP